MSDTKVAKIKVTVNKGDYSHVENVQIKLGINTIPTATLTTVPGKPEKAVIHPLSDDALLGISAAQKTRISGGARPDVTIYATDGVGGSLVLTGFLVAPIMEVSTSSVNIQYSVVGIDAALDALDMSIYNNRPPKIRADEQYDGLQPLPTAETGDIPSIIAAVSNVLLANAEASKLELKDDKEKQLMMHQHELNTSALGVSPFGLLQAILTNSTGVVYKSWAAANKANPELGRIITSRIADALKQKTSGFWNVFNSLLASYQMYYVPNTSGSGKLKLASDRLVVTGGEKKLSPRSVSVADGSTRILQPGGVVLTSVALEGIRAGEGGEVALRSTISAQYPTPLLPGYVHREVIPIWIPSNIGIPAVEAENSKQPAYLSVANYKKTKNKSLAFKEKINDTARELLTEYAQQIFENIQLADSTVTMILPLALDLEVGVRYKFSVLPGTQTFEGFVSSVIHSINLREGKSLDSFTQLSLTHVKY